MPIAAASRAPLGLFSLKYCSEKLGGLGGLDAASAHSISARMIAWSSFANSVQLPISPSCTSMTRAGSWG